MTTGRPRPPLDRLVAVPTRPVPLATTPPDVEGTDLAGEPVSVQVTGSGRWMLLLFLSSGCDGCRPLWPPAARPSLLGLGGGDAVVVVTRDAGQEDTGELRALAGDPGQRATVVMSSAAWKAYGVLGPPFFALVDASRGKVASEGVAWSPTQVARDVGRARRVAGERVRG